MSEKMSVCLLLFSVFSCSSRANEIENETFGNLNNAAGSVLIVNNPAAKAEILGFKKDSEQATYQNKDHVGYYIGMYGPINQIKTKNNEVSFYNNSFTLPVSYSIDDIKLGMFVVTDDVNRYSGRIIAVDKRSRNITVSSWYKSGDQQAGQVPANGSRLIINAADKLWGQNTNVFINKLSTARTATGYELGIISDGSHGNPVWGFHAANLSNVGPPFQQAFRISGNWNIGYYASSQTGTGLWVDSPLNNGIVINDANDKAWGGSALLLNTNGVNKESFILKSIAKNKVDFYIRSNGMKSNNIQELLRVTHDTALTYSGPSVILCKNKKKMILSLPPVNERGVIFEVRSVLGNEVAIRSKNEGFLINKSKGLYAKIINDGSGWVLLNQGG